MHKRQRRQEAQAHLDQPPSENMVLKTDDKHPNDFEPQSASNGPEEIQNSCGVK